MESGNVSEPSDVFGTLAVSRVATSLPPRQRDAGEGAGAGVAWFLASARPTPHGDTGLRIGQADASGPRAGSVLPYRFGLTS